MNNHPDKYDAKNVRPRGSRPTIGILAEVGGSPYHRALWKGCIDAASQLDVNLIWFLSDVARPSKNGVQHSIFHDLITAERVDGLLISGTLGNYVTTTEFESFINGYRPIPMLGITQIPGLPCVIVDNGKGMADTVAHLIKDHGYRRIAFICGSESNQEAAVRYRAYVNVLEEHGLSLDLDLVTPGTFVYQAGIDAVRLLLDERKVKIEAIVAANDWMALGALKALQDRGLRVPDDVALAGFDDTSEAMVSSPPLTTVRQPIQQLGYVSIKTMLKLLAGEQISAQTMLPTRLMARQSCGCAEPTMANITVERLAEKRQPLPKVIAAQRESILLEMAQVMEEDFSSFPNWAEQLLTAFLDEIGSGAASGPSNVKIGLQGPFLSTLCRVLKKANTAGNQINNVQKVISVLRRHILPHISDVDTLAHVEALFDQARVVTDTMQQKNWMIQEVEKSQLNSVLGLLRNSLATRLEMKHLLDVLNHRVPQLGFFSFYLSLYEAQARFTPWSRQIMAFVEGKQVEVDPAGQRFLSHRLIPDELMPQERRYTWIVGPLYYEDNQFGCLTLEVGSREAEVYGSLTRLIGGSMQDALLMQQLEVRKMQMSTAAEISRAASEVLDLDELIQQAVDLVQERFGLYYAGLFLLEGEWAVLRAGTGKVGRQMLAQSYKLKVDDKSTVGRSVTGQRACIVLDVGKEAVHFENSLLPETRSEMALPLTSRGQSIGALMVQSTQEAAFDDEDIAVFQTMADQLASAIMNARLYKEARRAYDEVEQQVQSRTLELEQEIVQREQAQQESVRLQQAVIEAQQRAIQELSTPVIPIMEHIIVMPLIGNIDSQRAREITRSLLAGISKNRAKVIILDVTGVRVMDTGIVNYLNRTIQAARLKGAHPIVTGISEAVAETIVNLGIDWHGVDTLSDLQTGLTVALRSLGIELEKR